MGVATGGFLRSEDLFCFFWFTTGGVYLWEIDEVFYRDGGVRYYDITYGGTPAGLSAP